MPARTPASSQRIEEASLNAWPALHQMLLDGWLLRFSRGFTKRANCIVPLYPALQPMEDKVRHCEHVYTREGLKTIFRLTSASENADLDSYLAGRGYSRVEPTLVLTSELAHQHLPETSTVCWLDREPWLNAYAGLNQMPARARKLHGAIIRGIRGECAFAIIGSPDSPVACGLAVREEKLAGLFDIYTDPAHRGRGHAHALVGALLGRVRERGADTAYLQMITGNDAARRLYEHYGFSEIYHYWYRVSDCAAEHSVS